MAVVIFKIEDMKEFREVTSKKSCNGIHVTYGDVFRIEKREARWKWVVYCPKGIQSFSRKKDAVGFGNLIKSVE